MEIYNTYMLGAGKLVDCEYVLVYNTESFSKRANDLYVDGISISKSNFLPLLSKTPDKRGIHEVVEKILKIKNNSGELVYNVSEVNRSTDPSSKYYSDFIVSNRKDNIVGPDGFNVIVYLCSNGGFELVPIGFSTFLEPQGSSVFTESGKYMIRKNYYVRNLHIYIGFDNQLLFDTEKLNLLDNLSSTANLSKRDLRGTENWNYASVSSAKEKVGHVERPLYTNRIYSTVSGRGQYIFSDTNSFILDRNNKVIEKTKLCINKNLHVDRFNNAFGNYQLGFYKGDPALYVWNIGNNYSIYSLARKNLVGNTVMYTNPVNTGRLILNSSVYRLPSYDINYKSKIEFFSGNLVQTAHTNNETGEVVRKVFNLDLQDNRDNDNNAGWMNFGDDLALLDPLDIKNQVRTTKKLIFATKEEAEKSIPELTDIHFDLGRYSSECSINVEGKRGEWFIIGHPTIDIKILTNMTKTVLIRSSELGGVMFINNQVLIIKNPNPDRLSEITYTLFDSDGKFMTSGASDYLSTYYNNLDALKEYKVPGRRKRLMIDNSINSTNSILDLQRSFLAYFRRNTLPTSLTDFEIIGGLCGLVFYRLGSLVNYL